MTIGVNSVCWLKENQLKTIDFTAFSARKWYNKVHGFNWSQIFFRAVLIEKYHQEEKVMGRIQRRNSPLKTKEPWCSMPPALHLISDIHRIFPCWMKQEKNWKRSSFVFAKHMDFPDPACTAEWQEKIILHLQKPKSAALRKSE